MVTSPGDMISAAFGSTPEAKVAANLASLNEIITEVVQAMADYGWTDAEFAALTRGILRGHSFALGYSFQGEQPPG